MRDSQRIEIAGHTGETGSIEAIWTLLIEGGEAARAKIKRGFVG